MNTAHLDPLQPDATSAAAPMPAPLAGAAAAPELAQDGLAQPQPAEKAANDAADNVVGSASAAYDYTAPAVSAAAAAAEFVARIFADVGAPDAATQASADAPSAADHASTGDSPGTVGDAPAAITAAEDPAPQAAPALEGKQVLVLGLGASGLAMARWCVRCGAQVTVADTRASPPQLAQLRTELPQVEFVAGAFDSALVQARALHAVYRSPGLSPAEIAPVVVAAGALQISVEGELGLYSLALRELRAAQGYAPAVLAITGTNGKTTVTSLTALLAQCAGKSVAIAGNIGPTLLDTLAQHIDAGTLPEVWVLELSSFQLDGVTIGASGFEPTAAVVLNITQDHLDWHGSMAAYAQAKARIFGEQALMVLNREDPEVMALLPPPVRVRLQKPQQRAHVTFGGDMPQRPGDFGIEVVSGMAWLVRAHEADETVRGAKGARAQQADLHIQRLMPEGALRIRGRHNAINALAALALAQAA
ncbi:Mur ligase family protein, partial [Diaphorobacter sp.]|uniref:Mur ligase family protein n=1 Tax=Diaphorobacter sp. TaxID=1934310 RepID=UPI003D0B5B6C